MLVAARRRWRKRGISTLCVDQPGTGEAMRLHGLPATPYSERWASNGSTGWSSRPTSMRRGIGMTGISLGGYFAPRAVAFEPRFASGAVWGANHNWAEVQQKRLRREGENPVPHYWAHVHVGVRRRATWRTSIAKIEGHDLERRDGADHRAVPRHPRRDRTARSRSTTRTRATTS